MVDQTYSGTPSAPKIVVSSILLFCIPYKIDPLMASSSLMISPVRILLDGISSEQDNPSLSRAIRQSVFLLCEGSPSPAS
uniref:Uncharacterized protein n=1 Tax=Arundo donax TaxID=35708 RepID=A0A0A9H6T9_ARUDO